MHRTWLAVVLSGLLTSSAAAETSEALNVDELQRACACLSDGGSDDAVSAICKRLNADAPSYSDWSTIARLPTATAVRTAAAKCPAPTPSTGEKTVHPETSVPGVQLNQSAILWGASDFLVSRANQELHTWATERFLTKLCPKGGEADGEAPEPRLFPKSCAYFADVELEGLLGGMATFQAAMRQDVAHLPVLVFEQLFAKANHDAAAMDASAVGAMLAMSLEAQLVGTGGLRALAAPALTLKPPLALTAQMPVSVAMFQVSALFAGLPVSGTGVVTVPITGKPVEYAIMTLAVNSADASTPIGRALQRVQASAESSISQALRGINPAALAGLLAQLRDAVREFKETADLMREAGADASYRLRVFGRLAELSFGIIESATAALAKQHYKDSMVLVVLATSKRIASHLATANYAAAGLEILGAAAAVGLEAALPKDFPRLASFATELAQAPSPDSAAATIDRFAAPVGSYRMKRASRWYARVNGYLGVGGGVEWAKQAEDSWQSTQRAASFGFWAPIGIEVGLGSEFLPCRCGSLGLLLQAIDLGVLANWRIKGPGDDVSARPEVGVAQVFSPGGFLAWGLPEAPLSFAVGVALAPKLRSLETNTAEVATRDAFRVQLNFAVDIPIFP